MVWAKVKESLKETLADNIFHLWIEPLQFEQFQGDRLYLSGPDRYFSAYVKQNFSSVIEDKLQENGLQSTQIIFCEKSREREPISSTGKGTPRTQMRLPNVPQNNSKSRSLHPRYTFDEFMVGESNILAESACRSIVAEDGLVGPCLYINSGTGLGKSHLTHAVAHQVFTESPMTRLHYLTAKQFAAEMIRGIQTKTMDDFKRKYQENCDILLVEDVHSLTGKKKTQEELNDILDFLIKSGKRVILTSNSAPRDLIGIDNEFRSRMTSGLVTTMKAPDVNTRYRIVEKKALQQQLQLNEDLVGYLANHIRGDVRKIESALIAIRARARLAGGHIDMDLVRQVVGSVVGANQILTAAMICELVSGQFKVSVKELQSKSRKKAFTTPRQIAMYLSRKYTEESLVDIGKTFNRDHSTVLHSIKVVSNMMVRDTSVNAQLEILGNKVKQL
ncbi:MAG: chromosomal replication initiator protein DnaA [Proteobacteria bacterium]|nr:chromosomal replication initiator protein DnaA [Pseudomonadota bacterium]